MQTSLPVTRRDLLSTAIQNAAVIRSDPPIRSWCRPAAGLDGGLPSFSFIRRIPIQKQMAATNDRPPSSMCVGLVLLHRELYHRGSRAAAGPEGGPLAPRPVFKFGAARVRRPSPPHVNRSGVEPDFTTKNVDCV